MNDIILRAFLLLILLVTSTFTSIVFPDVHAVNNLVTATSSNNDLTTNLQFTNNEGNISGISSLILQIGQGVNFKSFKADNGWSGIKTGSSTLAFSSTSPLKAGQSVNFAITTDKPNPIITWKALNDKNNELSSGELGPHAPIGTTKSGTTGSTIESKTPTKSHAVFDGSNFRIIPSTPSPESSVRIVGQSFAASANLDLYIGNNKIESFTTNDNGNFVITAKIPADQPIESVSFFVKDQTGNSKTFSTTIQKVHERRNQNQNEALTVNVDSILHRGDTKFINGTATPGSTLTIEINEDNGNSITTLTTVADKTGHYSLSDTIPIDRPFGTYNVVVSDGKNKVSKEYKVVTTHQMSLSLSSQKVDPGQTIIINGTAVSNQHVIFVIKNPPGNEIFAKDVNVTSDGKIALLYKTDNAALKGTYSVIATQGTDEVILYFGVGENPVPQIILFMDKLNYQNTDKPEIHISGSPSSTLNLVIVDPSGKQKFADTINLGPDGFSTYSFNVTSYTPGIYSAVIARGNDKAITNFAVGLQTGSGAITMKTVKDAYLLGDNIIILGKSNPNVIIKITLTDPNGVIQKSQDVFTDKLGIFSSSVFRIPGDGTTGIWKLEATSGINHFRLDLTVKSIEEGISINLDRIPAIYARGDIVTISGSGAGRSTTVIIDVLGTNSTKIVSLDITSTNRGEYNTLWKIPVNFTPGTYTVQAKYTGGQISIPIIIQ